MLDWFFGNQFYKKHREKIQIVLDLLIVCFSYILAYWTKFNFRFDFHSFVLHKLFIFAVIVLFIYIVYFIAFGIYRSLWKYIGVVEVVRLTLADVFATITIMALTLFYSQNLDYVSIELVAGCFAALMMFSLRAIYRLFRRYTLRVGDAKNAVIIGAGDAGNILLKEINQNEKLNYKVVGFVDDYKKKYMIEGLSILGTCLDLKEIKEKYHVEVALIAMRNVSKKQLRNIVEQCQAVHLPVQMMSESIFGNQLKKKNVLSDVKIEDLLGRGEIHLDQHEIASYITDKRILVTGAGGSIGSELCRQILKFKPKELVMLDINENDLYLLEQEFNRDREHGKLDKDIKIVSIITSIRDAKGLDQVFKLYQPEVVYHAAAHKHVPLMETRPMEAIKNNVFGTRNVILTCIKYKVSRFIMISTDKAVNPTNVMGATKRMTEMILQAYGDNGVTKMAAVRFGNVLGSHGSVIPIFSKQIEEGGPVTITDKNIIRYFMTIPEAAQLVLQAGYYADKGEIFVLDMGEPVKILDLAEKMIKLCGLEPYEDIEIKEIGLRPGEKMFEELHLGGETFSKTKNDLIYKNDIMHISLDELNKRLDVLEDLISNEENIGIIKNKLLNLIITDNQ
ncbi:nucleoside-diphosphate sugar epimerase/dehydratase [uncultured Traorella sp.]|uniref:polysaccharide biosynthesis protein n=1 Tax=uncultured Traorella sp. TaxID=1929048 RepID=UPI0025E0E468|nr:nucleoside-diphosphate sugar epimerase/dehydratase [uncultured Traorella sp.]